MTTEERFEHIQCTMDLFATGLSRCQATLQVVSESLQTVAESHIRLQGMVRTLVDAQAHHGELLSQFLQVTDQRLTLSEKTWNERTKRMDEAWNERISQLEEAIARSIDAADARMRRIEENLDGLIRAISTEHSKGKGKLPRGSGPGRK